MMVCQLEERQTWGLDRWENPRRSLVEDSKRFLPSEKKRREGVRCARDKLRGRDWSEGWAERGVDDIGEMPVPVLVGGTGWIGRVFLDVG